MRQLSSNRCFGGEQRIYEHESSVIGLPMKFGIYLPPQALEAQPNGKKCKTLFYLAGLTCNEETFAIKAHAQALAAELGLILVTPDTSPRGTDVADDAAYDLGQGAGFYLNATQAPWAAHYRMEDYVVQELPALIEAHFPASTHRAISGHSMGGHGALTLALKYPGRYASVSDFAPIVAPSQVRWGEKAFTGYLGADTSRWLAHDASALMQQNASAPFPGGILIDQGLGDKFLADQLHPELFEAACAAVGQPLLLRRHAGYDHGYYFIQSFMADHLAHHAAVLTP